MRRLGWDTVCEIGILKSPSKIVVGDILGRNMANSSIKDEIFDSGGQ